MKFWLSIAKAIDAANEYVGRGVLWLVGGATLISALQAVARYRRPLCGVLVWLSFPGFVVSFASGEMSPDAGGLMRWPVRLLIPLGFALLGLHGVAGLRRRLAFLRGQLTLTL